MSTETSYSNLRANLSSYLDKVVNDQEIVFIRLKGKPAVAMVPAEELSGLMETAHLLRSPANAKRLLSALADAKRGLGKPSSIEALRRDVGLDPKR